MAVYKVPQDVEAEDKLLGPFSFRQFIYLMIVGVAIAIGWGLSRIFIGLIIIPLPVVIFFGALALPLRKDQPMETYLAAVVKYFLMPKKRIWEADGIDSLIEITVPKQVEQRLTKDLSQREAESKLGYLANLIDTGGWSTRSVDTSLKGDVYAEATNANDMLDVYDPLSQSIDDLMNKKTIEARKELIEQFKTGNFETHKEEPAQAPTTVTINPALEQLQSTPVQPSATQPSPDIIKLAKENELTVDLIAKQADRIQTKKDSSGEVFISLR